MTQQSPNRAGGNLQFLCKLVYRDYEWFSVRNFYLERASSSRERGEALACPPLWLFVCKKFKVSVRSHRRDSVPILKKRAKQYCHLTGNHFTQNSDRKTQTRREIALRGGPDALNEDRGSRCGLLVSYLATTLRPFKRIRQPIGDHPFQQQRPKTPFPDVFVSEPWWRNWQTHQT